MMLIFDNFHKCYGGFGDTLFLRGQPHFFCACLDGFVFLCNNCVFDPKQDVTLKQFFLQYETAYFRTDLSTVRILCSRL